MLCPPLETQGAEAATVKVDTLQSNKRNAKKDVKCD